MLIKHQNHRWINPGREGTENLYSSHISNMKGSTGKAKTVPIWIFILGQKAGITGQWQYLTFRSQVSSSMGYSGKYKIKVYFRCRRGALSRKHRMGSVVWLGKLSFQYNLNNLEKTVKAIQNHQILAFCNVPYGKSNSMGRIWRHTVLQDMRGWN